MLTYLPAMLMARLAGFAVLLGAAHLLDPTSTGLLALALLVGEVCEGIFLNWLRIFVLRQGSARGQISVRTARLCLVCWLAGLGAAGGLAALIGTLVAGGDAPAFIGVALAYLIALSLFKCGLVLLQMGRQARLHALLEGARGLIMAPLAIWAMAESGDWLVAMHILAGVTGMAGFLALWCTRPRIGGDDERPALPEMRAMAPPLIGLAALNFVIGSIDRLTLGFSLSPAALAPYAASAALGRQGFDIATNAVNAGGFPALVAARAGGNSRGLLGAQAQLLLGLLLAGYVGLVLTRHDLADLILPQAYRPEATMLLPIIGLGAVAINLKNGLTDSVLLIEGRYWRQMMGLGAGAAMAVGMALVLVPFWGGIGAATAFAAGSLTVLGVSFWQARAFLRIEADWPALVSILAPAVAVMLACVSMAALFAEAEVFIRLMATIVVAAPLTLWALQARMGRSASHGG